MPKVGGAQKTAGGSERATDADIQRRTVPATIAATADSPKLRRQLGGVGKRMVRATGNPLHVGGELKRRVAQIDLSFADNVGATTGKSVSDIVEICPIVETFSKQGINGSWETRRTNTHGPVTVVFANETSPTSIVSVAGSIRTAQ